VVDSKPGVDGSAIASRLCLVGVVSPGKGRLRRAAAAVLIILVPLALVSAATARSAAKPPVAKASCATLLLQKGGSGKLAVKAAKGSLPIASAQLAPGTKTKTKVRTIKPAGKAAFKYAFAKKQGKAENVRVVVTFRKGRTTQRKTVVCAVKIGSPTATLNIAFDGDGVGTITPAPTGAACTNNKAPCAVDYKSGAKVTLKADPAATSTFTGWSGACSGTGATCTVKVRGISNVTAKFTRKTFTVTIVKAGEGGGTVTSDGPLACGATCSATIPAGTIVRLKAAPDVNSRLVGWTGECTSTVSQCNVSVDGDITVTVTFDKLGKRMSVSRSGTGDGTISADPSGVDCGSTCAFTYPAGTQVTLTATAASGSLFAGWGPSTPCGSSTTATCTVTMDAVKFISADFEKGVPITVVIDGNGTVSGPDLSCSGNTCSGLFFPQGYVEFTATAAAGSHFDYWTGCPQDKDLPANVCKQHANTLDPTVHAVFATP
jgi:hypothetical protein